MTTKTPSGIEAYQLGRSFTVMPIPMVPDHCVSIPAGPITFVVESRVLSDEAIIENERDRGTSDGVVHDNDVDDYGASLHVCDEHGLGGLEFLRFDAFDNEPHYHYILNESQRNVVVRLDDNAEGDPLEWVLRVVANRLPEMLEAAEAGELAERARASSGVIDEAFQRLDTVLRDAARRAAELHRG